MSSSYGTSKVKNKALVSTPHLVNKLTSDIFNNRQIPPPKHFIASSVITNSRECYMKNE